MVKKIAFILFSVGIVVTGVYGFRKLNYWERSAWIFRYSNSDQRFEGRGGRGYPEFRDRRERGRETFEGRSERGSREFRQGYSGDSRDSTQREFSPRSGRNFSQRPEDRDFSQRPEDRATFRPGDGGRGGHGRGDFHGGQKIRLRNVWWFLAVFSAFTVVALYLDRAWLHIRRKRTHSTG